MSQTLTLRPLLEYFGTTVHDYYYTAPRASEQFHIPEFPGYAYSGVAFMVSENPATLPDGTELIPLYEFTFANGQHFYTTQQVEGAGQNHTATYWVLPNSTTDYGALPIRRYAQLTPANVGNVHFYTVDGSAAPSVEWRREGDMGHAVPAVKVHVGLNRDVVTTSTTVVENGTPQRVPDGDINVYPTVGSLIVFAREGIEYLLDSILIRRVVDNTEWALDLKAPSAASGCPFEVVGSWQGGYGSYLLDKHDENSAEDVVYDYTIFVKHENGETYRHDPKVINRSGTTTAPIHHR